MSKADQYTELLMNILSIPSLSREEKDRADFLEKWIKGRTWQVQRQANNLLVSTDGKIAAKTLLLNSHLDTVKPGPGWNTEPFLPILQGEKISGLGSNDAGASVVSLLAAFEELAQSGEADKLLLLLSAEEEVSGKNGLESVLPILGNIKFAIVGEPTTMEPAVAERGLMVIDGIAHGKNGHAARNEGVNAIYKVMEDIQKLKDFEFKDRSDWLPDPSVNITVISAGSNHNVIPAECSFVIDVRSNDRYPNERLLKMIREICSSELKARSTRLNASALPEKHPAYRVVKTLGLQPFGSSSMSDMALMPFPAVKIGPGDSARSHTANEFIMTTEIGDAIQVYKNLIEEIQNVI